MCHVRSQLSLLCHMAPLPASSGPAQESLQCLSLSCSTWITFRVFVRFLLPILIISIASGELGVRPTEAGLLCWCTLVKVADNEGCSLPESWAVSAPKTSYYGDNGAVAFIEYPICHLQQSSFSHSSQRKDNPGHIDLPSCLPWLLLSEIRNIRRKIN